MSPQAGYVLQEQVVPRLHSAIPNCVHCVGAEDHQELIQDATAMAAKLMHNVEIQGKQVTPGNVAYYTIQHVKSGRRSTGSSNADVVGSMTQLNGRTRLTSFEEPAAINEECGGEIFLFHDVISDDQEDPSTKAARKLDWESLLAALTPREQAIIEFIAEGKTLREVAQLFRVGDSTMQNSKRRLTKALLEFMGEDILAQVQRSPGWKNSLQASKEKIACREERKR